MTIFFSIFLLFLKHIVFYLLYDQTDLVTDLR